MNRFKILLLILFIGLLCILGNFWFLKSIQKFSQPLPSKESILKPKREEMRVLEKLEHQGTYISLTNEVFGREDPFAPY